MSSLKYKIAGVLFLVQVTILAFVIWQTFSQSISSSRKQIDAVERTTLKLVGESAKTALFTEELDSIQSHLDNLRSDPNIERAILLDHRGIIVASNRLSELGNTRPMIQDTQETYWRELKIANLSDHLGTFFVQYSNKAFNAVYFETLRHVLLIAAIGVFASGILSLILSTLLTRRLNKVVDTVDKVTAGDYSVRSELSGRDEVSRLGQAFDAMIRRVEEERNKLSDLNYELEQRVKNRTRHLEVALQENKTFSYSVSHDLRGPVRRMSAYAQILKEDYADKLDEEGAGVIERLLRNNIEMNNLIDSLLALSRVSRGEMKRSAINLSDLFTSVISEVRELEQDHLVETRVMPDMEIYADANLMRRVVENLINNAWKFTRGTAAPLIEVGCTHGEQTIYYCKDNGAGFESQYSEKLFAPFQRLHSQEAFQGTGIGLSTVQRIIHRHGGRIWAEGEPDKGAVFYFTVSDSDNDNDVDLDEV